MALRDVSLVLEPGEIRAVLGENGAGKTTLMNILYGTLHADAGRIVVRGTDVTTGWSPRRAIASGIGMIHQHFSLISAHTVLENVVMPTLRWRDVSPDWKTHREKVGHLCGQYGFNLPFDTAIENLSVGQRLQVEILKILYLGATVLILDEPTSVLTPQQTSALLGMLRRLQHQGHTVVFITHKLPEALAISTRITVLRQGVHVATVNRADTSPTELARMMVNREWTPALRQTRPSSGAATVLEVADLVVEGYAGRVAVNGVSLRVGAGEIMAVAGVAGNGQTEMAEGIAGYRRVLRGAVRINGVEVTTRTIRDRRRLGLGFIPEDRYTRGAIREMSVAENLILDRAVEPPFSVRGVLQVGEIRTWALRQMKEYDIRARSPGDPAGALSGGNLQRLVLARTLSADPKVIVASEPTRGLDFSATEYVRNALLECARRGVAVLLISSDLDELLDLSHEMIVMFGGRIVGALTREQFDLERIGLLMGGQPVM